MRKIWSAFVCMAFALALFAGCKTLPAGTGVISGGGAPPPPPPPPPPGALAELFSIATSFGAGFAVAVGASGSILQSTSAPSGFATQFPRGSWQLIPTNPAIATSLFGVTFETSSFGSLQNVLAVGDAGVILESISSGGNSPNTWVFGAGTPGFSVTDCGGPVSLSGSTLYGVSSFSDGQPAVIVGGGPGGGPFTNICGTKGIIAVSTPSSGTPQLPFNGWQLVDTINGGGSVPSVGFHGVSFAQPTSSLGNSFSTYAAVVGENGTILIGNSTAGLQTGSNWTLVPTTPVTTGQFNSVAIAQGNQHAIAVGNNGIIYGTDTLTNVTPANPWLLITPTPGIIPSGATSITYKSVHFVPGSSLTAAITGTVTVAGAPLPIVLTLTSCCNASSTFANVTPSASTFSSLTTLDGVWGSIGPAQNLILASGNGEFILESDAGQGTISTSWQKDSP